MAYVVGSSGIPDYLTDGFYRCYLEKALLTRKRLRLIAIVWLVVLTAVSLQPYRPPGESQTSGHRIAHAIAFGVPALMLLRLARSLRQQWAASLIVLCLALAIETAQHLIYGNAFEWWDVRDDTIGLLIAILLHRWTRARWLLNLDRD